MEYQIRAFANDINLIRRKKNDRTYQIRAFANDINLWKRKDRMYQIRTFAKDINLIWRKRNDRMLWMAKFNTNIGLRMLFPKFIIFYPLWITENGLDWLRKDIVIIFFHICFRAISDLEKIFLSYLFKHFCPIFSEQFLAHA